MAIIPCPECSKKISSHVSICAHCGFQTGEVSEQQLNVYQLRKLRDKIYQISMISYAVITVFVAAFGWFWWDSGGFEHASSPGPFVLMGISAVAYLAVRLALFRSRHRQKTLRRKDFLRPELRRKS